MNAKTNPRDFPLDVILKMISQELDNNKKRKNNKIEISIAYNVDDFDTLHSYKQAMKTLTEKKIVKNIKDLIRSGYLQDGEHEMEMSFYTPSFILNKKELDKFLVETSRVPMYSLSMDQQRRLLLNNKYLLGTLQFNSTNYYFIELCLEKINGIITQEDITERSSKKPQRFHTILGNLRIAPSLTKIFFPNVGANFAQFRNEVTTEDLLDLETDVKKANRFIKTLRKIKVVSSNKQ